MKTITLTKGKFALVDNEDFERLNVWKWCFDGSYAVRFTWENKIKIKIYLHRLITNAKRGEETDHINRNKLDCRKNNLRLVTRSENMRNRPSYGKFGVVGTSWSTKYRKWVAQITINYKTIFLGYFKTQEKASLAYQETLKKIL